MSAHVALHSVSRIVVEADGCPTGQNGDMIWWQKIRLFGRKGEEIGEITLHLTDAGVALPIGDQPPYFGTDPRMSALEDREVAPF